MRRCVYATIALLAVALIVLKVVDAVRSPQAESMLENDSVALVPISSSPFLNTNPEVGYVGTDSCRTCHASHEISFRRTGMGQSMAELDPSREPVDGAFDHPASKRRYQVRRRGSQLWHRELLLAQGADEVLLAEYPLKYVVGSGRHSRTYLVEIDGFLTESPATWYSAQKAWGMSPGYEAAEQPGFARPVEENCLYCHAGRVEALGGTLHKLKVLEAPISCERCHGPGALHVARHNAEASDGAAAGIDHTIVNPVHLPRELAEAVCQQCHLQSDAASLARGRKRTDFRPGLPLQDFKHDYRLESSNPAMTVVGHVEQLHLSRCYQAAPTLTCLTCHDPHGSARTKESPPREQAVCLKCHAPERCKVDGVVRERESPGNNCLHCHMPRSQTEIPHLAFTHHRIGIHRKSTSTDKTRAAAGNLEPVLDLSRFGKAERNRSLGLAYLDMGQKQKSPELAAPFLHRALESLQAANASGLGDVSLHASQDLARFLLLRTSPDKPMGLTESPLDAGERCSALFATAYSAILHGTPDAAMPYLKKLIELRRDATDWLLLAGCEQSAGNLTAAIAALEQAARINPRLWQAHRQLADHYQQQGNRERVAWHERRALP